MTLKACCFVCLLAVGCYIKHNFDFVGVVLNKIRITLEQPAKLEADPTPSSVSMLCWVCLPTVGPDLLILP